jgi:RNA polymerase sigma-70 factor, ECF subfamily
MNASAGLSSLYRQHRRKALAIAQRILGDRDEAEDVVQEVFSRLCLREPNFDGRSAYSTWLYRVMVNSSINSLRSRKRRSKLETERNAPLSPEQQAIGRQMEEKFLSALQGVSKKHRQVLWLREMRGLSYPEIAAHLGIPEGTVKSTLNRGRAQVLKIMERQGIDVQ